MQDNEALKGDAEIDIEQTETQERIEIDAQRFLKWQKDANRQLKEFREFKESLSRNQQSNRDEEAGVNPRGRGADAPGGAAQEAKGLTQNDLIHFATYSRLVGKLSDDEANEFDSMDAPYKERITALNFYLKGKGKSTGVSKTEATEEPQTKKTRTSNPETPKGSVGVPSFRTQKEYMKAKPEDRKLWRSAGNSPSALPE